VLNAREDRFAELMKLASGAAGTAAEPPPDLEARLLAYAEGAAAGAARTRRRFLPALFALSAATAAVSAFALLPERVPSPAAPAVATPALPEAPKTVASVAPAPAPMPAATAPTVPLATALRGAPDWRSRRAATLQVAQAEADEAGTKLLARALSDDPDWRVREVALRALVKRTSREAALALAQATLDPHLGIRLPAVNALESRLDLGAPVTDALLRRLDRDPDWRVRESALRLLLRSPESERAATLALADHHRRLRERAREVLAHLR
jgi:hypothetical protein